MKTIVTISLLLLGCGGESFSSGEEEGGLGAGGDVGAPGGAGGDPEPAAGGRLGSTGGGAGGALAAGGASAGGAPLGGAGAGGEAPEAGGAGPGGAAAAGGATSGGGGAAGGAEGYTYQGCGRLFSKSSGETEDSDVVCSELEVHCADWVTTHPLQRCHQFPICARQTTGSGTCGAIEHPEANLDAYVDGWAQLCPAGSRGDRTRDGVLGRACCFTLLEAGVDYGSGCERTPEALACADAQCWGAHPPLEALGL